MDAFSISSFLAGKHPDMNLLNCISRSLEMNISKLDKIRSLSKKPLLSPGGLGSFDEFGAMLSWKVSHEGKNYIYYVFNRVIFKFYKKLTTSDSIRPSRANKYGIEG